jgi:starch-binding outer membrane protein, SusD/RagB family
MTRRVWRAGLAIAALAASTACDISKLDVPQMNAPTESGVTAAPRSGAQLLATGVLWWERFNRPAFVSDVGVFGRESYNYFPTDARFVSHYLIGQTSGGVKQLDPTGFASGNWGNLYRNIRTAISLANLADAAATFTAQEKSATKGFAKTLQALDLYYLIVTRDTLGVAIDVSEDPTQPGPWASRDAVWTAISAILDDAKTDLAAAGSTPFPFKLNTGFAGFDTPANFLKFNRAIAARVFANRGSIGCAACWAQARQALTESFIKDPASQADLDIGVYHVYSGAAGDAINGMNFVANSNLLAHASIMNDAQLKPDGTRDARVERKVAPLPTPRAAPGSNNGIPATHFFTIYSTTTTPAPIIRNEELLLLRAEANIAAGGNPAQALQDINAVRTVSGGLAPLGTLGADPIATLLYERRMSLLFEGHRWNDMRRYGRLNQLPLDLTTHFVAKVMPVPKTECDARPPELDPAVGC